MSNQEELIKDFQASVEQDTKKRQKSIEEGQALDKEIQMRMAAGEIGISHGTDNYVGVIMLSLAAVVTILLLYVIFGVSPDHYSG